MIDFSELEGFEWDDGNISKNWLKHEVNTAECEEVFSNSPLLTFPDDAHSRIEIRIYVLGKTNSNRLLFIAFTVRKQNIRVISARDMNKKEKNHYEKHDEKT
jgi:uncharacterized DUF497 family protein